MKELDNGGNDPIRNLYGHVMNMDAREVHDRLDSVIQRLKVEHSKQPFSKESAEYWVLHSDECFSDNGLHDRGLVSIFLLNLVSLQPGEAMYLPAGVLHAYLEGVGVELMANSNNVLRGGLTSKHVDVDELLKHVSFESEIVGVLSPDPSHGSSNVRKYQTATPEFELHQIFSGTGRMETDQTSNGPEILLPTIVPSSEDCLVKSSGGDLCLRQGNPVLICHGVDYTLELAPGVEMFRALVP